MVKRMNNVLAIDIETKNLSHEIGGWGNTHMFLVSTVCTHDGNISKAYVEDNIIDSIEKTQYEVFPLSQLKYDLDDHFEKGGLLLGHNIGAFDLPVLRDSMDIFCITKYIKNEQYIDTSKYLVKEYGERFSLENLVNHNFGETKQLESIQAPALWKQQEYQTVVDYCVDDCKLVYKLWKRGKDNLIDAFSIEKEEVVKMEVNW